MVLERVLIKKILSLTIFSILVPIWVYLGKSTRPTFGFKYETWIYSIPVSQRTLNLKRWAVYTGSHKGIDWWMSNTALKLHSLYFIFTICFSKNHVFEEFPAVSQELKNSTVSTKPAEWAVNNRAAGVISGCSPALAEIPNTCNTNFGECCWTHTDWSKD